MAETKKQAVIAFFTAKETLFFSRAGLGSSPPIYLPSSKTKI
jgi:hypothetical protein